MYLYGMCVCLCMCAFVLEKPLPAAFCHFSCATAHFPHILTTTATRFDTHTQTFPYTTVHVHTFDTVTHRHRHKQLPPEVAAAAQPAPPNQCANNKAVNFCMRLNKLYIFVFSVEKVFQSWVVLGTATIRKKRSKNFIQIFFSWCVSEVYLIGQSHTSKSLKQKNNLWSKDWEKKGKKVNLQFDSIWVRAAKLPNHRVRMEI